MDDLSVFLPYIVPTVVERLGQSEMVEPCEELRLYLVEMLSSVTKICQGKIGVYIDDMIKILQRTLIDPFHDVRKVSESFKIVENWCKLKWKIGTQYLMIATSTKWVTVPLKESDNPLCIVCLWFQKQ